MPASHLSSFPLSRRQLLQVGGLSTLGLALPEFLQASAPGAAERQSHGPEKSCIFIDLYGGASHLDTWDLKPEAPDSIRGPYKPIDTCVPGLQISELQPRLAKLANRFSLIRSMTHRNSGHQDGTDCCLTGDSRPTEQTPYLGSIAARLRPATRPVPSYVWLLALGTDANRHYRSGGFFGPTHGPMFIGMVPHDNAHPDLRVRAFDPAEGLTAERLADRRDLLDRLQQDASSPPSDPWRRFQEQALDLVTRPEARKAFDVSQEPEKVRERYGRHLLGHNLLLARRLVEAGVRLVTVNGNSHSLNPKERFNIQTWDMHGQYGSIFGTGPMCLGSAVPCLDSALSALLEDLDQRGLLENTLVVVVGEFGRTPLISANGGHGVAARDHWPHCYSALLAGGGIGGGMVYGASDKTAGYVKDSPVSLEDFGATLLHALDIAPETPLVRPDGLARPASKGQPILKLFA